MNANSTTPHGEAANNAVILLPAKADGSKHLSYPSGAWLRQQGFDYLDYLAGTLTQGKQVPKLSDVTALPDVWGQAICFHAAFNNPKHVLYGTVVEEWRGLLTLVGLCRYRKLPLQFVSIDLDALAKKPYGVESVTSSTEQSANFGKVLRNSFPSFIDITDTDRLKIDLLLLPNSTGQLKPLGFTFDHTLVIPGRDYAGAFSPAEVPWGSWEDGAQGYPMHNPIPDLNDWEKVALAQWLDRLIAAVKKEPSNAANDCLTTHLKNFRSDLQINGETKEFFWVQVAPQAKVVKGIRTELSIVPIDETDSVVAPYPPNSKQAKEANSWAALLPPGFTKNPQKPSTIQVELRSELRNSPLKGAIILDPKWKLEWPDIAIPVINKILGDLSTDESRWINEIKQWKEDAANKGWLLLTPEDLFTASLTQLDSNAVLPNEFHPTGLNGFLLPLTGLALLLFDPNGLRRAFRLVNEQYLCPVAELTFALSTGENLVIKKAYSLEIEPRKISPPATLVQWPGYTSNIWQHYYLDARGRNVNPRIARTLTPRRLLDLLSGVDTPAAVSIVEKWLENDKAHTLIDSSRTESLWHNCFLSNRPIEAVSFEQCDGLCLIQSESVIEIKPGREHCKIAIDFGSSATQILVKIGAVPQGLLNAPVLKIFGNQQRPDSFEYNTEKSLLMSVLGERTNQDEVFLPPNKEAVVHGHSFLPLPGALSLVQSDIIKQKNIAFPAKYKFGAKYSGKSNYIDFSEKQSYLVQRILSESCLLAAATAVGGGANFTDIDWAFAFPSTYLSHNQKRFQACCDAAVAYSRYSPLEVMPPVKATHTMVLEPLAANKYFQSLQAVTNGISVVIDIGGHSTDICISLHTKPIWAGSLSVAGQQILTDFFIYNYSALEELAAQVINEPSQQTAFNELLKEINQNNHEALLTMRGFVESLFLTTHRSLKAPLKDKTKDKIENLVRLFVFGIMAYLRRILEFCQSEIGNDLDLPLSLFFCGRGSILIKDFLEEDVINKSCQQFLSGLPWSGNIFPVLFVEKDNAKQEVARGLLEILNDGNWTNSDLSQLAHRSPLPLGEEMAITGSTPTICKSNEYILAPALEDHTKLRLKSIKNFEEFLNSVTKRGVNLGAMNLADLLKDTAILVQKECARGEAARKEKISKEFDTDILIQLQPPFILALSACIKMLIKS